MFLLILFRLHLTKSRETTRISELFIMLLQLFHTCVHLEKIIDISLCLYNDVPMLVVESINQKNKPSHPVSSSEMEHRHTAEDYCVEIVTKSLVIWRTSRRITKLFESHFCHQLCLPLDRESSALCNLNGHGAALGIASQLVPDSLNAVRSLRAEW